MLSGHSFSASYCNPTLYSESALTVAELIPGQLIGIPSQVRLSPKLTVHTTSPATAYIASLRGSLNGLRVSTSRTTCTCCEPCRRLAGCGARCATACDAFELRAAGCGLLAARTELFSGFSFLPSPL